MNERAVWKFPLHEGVKEGSVEVEMPKGAVIRCVHTQRGVPTLWAEVDPEAPTETRLFEVFGTGEPIPGDMSVVRRYRGTVFSSGEFLVWHVYERIR